MLLWLLLNLLKPREEKTKLEYGLKRLRHTVRRGKRIW